MAIQNIRMRKKNGEDWDILYPITLSKNIKLEDGTNIQDFIDNVYSNVATEDRNGSMSKQDKEKLDGIEENANYYVHPSGPNVRHVTDIQISNWNDKYSKHEVDGLINGINTGLDWKKSVNTFDDIATTYPDAIKGWTVSTKDNDVTYRYNGTTWIAISANSIPLASKTTDGKMSKTDKINLDNMVTSVEGLEQSFESLNSYATSNITKLKTLSNGNKNISSQNKDDINSLKIGKSNIDHNHDNKYSKLDHNHDDRYSKLDHNHDNKYISRIDGVSNGDLHITKDGDKILDFRTSAGIVKSKIKSNENGDLLISSAQGKSVIIRTYGEDNTSNQLIVTKDNIFFNGSSLVAGKGTIGVGSIGNVLFDLDKDTGNLKVIPFKRSDGSYTANNATYLRNDNTWHKISPADIDAANRIHTHKLKDITDFSSAEKGELFISDGDSGIISTKLFKLFPAICKYKANIEHYKTKCEKLNISTIVCLDSAEEFNFSNNEWTAIKIENINTYLEVGTIVKDKISEAVYYVDEDIITPIVSTYPGGSITYTVDGYLINQSSNYRMVTDHEKTVWNGKASQAIATKTTNGLMSKDDKLKLDGLSNGTGWLKKFSTMIGNGADSSFNVDHGIGNNDISVTIKEVSSGEIVLADIFVLNNNTVQIKFGSVPANNQYRLTIIG